MEAAALRAHQRGPERPRHGAPGNGVHGRRAGAAEAQAQVAVAHGRDAVHQLVGERESRGWGGGAAKAGITDLNRIYTRDEMVTADVIFSATGVTNGSIVKGLRREPGFIETETILMRSKTGSVRRMFYRNPVKRA